jgi:3-hydroxyisobutyrate dehydrogenase-like beta-hydroxyacid dehydrogenase
MNIAVLGLGNMGLPIARHLVAAGHRVGVYNRSPGRADVLGTQVHRATSPREAGAAADVVVTMLADDQAVEDVVFATHSGLLPGMTPGAIHVSMSTISIAMARRLVDAHRRAGHEYVSAPVFGRPEVAESAQLFVVAAGRQAVLAKCRPLFDAIAQGVVTVGDDPPTANVVKLAGNFAIAAMLETLGETFALVRRAGVPPQLFLEIVNGALFKSPLYQNYGTLVAEQRFEPPGFRLKLGFKDVRLALQAGESFTVPLPLASLLRDHFLEAIAHGDGDRDWAALAEVSARNAGLETSDVHA